MIDLHLTSEQADELAVLLDGALRDMSAEIADTDNYDYRQGLEERRRRLRAIQSALTPTR